MRLKKGSGRRRLLNVNYFEPGTEIISKQICFANDLSGSFFLRNETPDGGWIYIS